MKNILITILVLFSLGSYAQTEQDAVNSEVRGHDVSYYAAAVCGASSGTNPYTLQLSPKTNQTGVNAFTLDNAAVGDIVITTNAIYEITATDNAINPTITVSLINNPLLLGIVIPPTGDCAVIRPTSQGLLPSYVADGSNGLSFGIEAFIGNFNANQIDAKLSTTSGTTNAVVINVPASGTLAVGTVVSNDGTGNYAAIDTSSAIAAHGLIREDNGARANVVTEGKIAVPSHGKTLHVPLYVSETAGELTETQYDENVQPIAIAFTTDSLLVTSKMMLGAGFGGGGKFVDGTDPNDAVYTTGSVGIGTTAPDASAALDVVSTTTGFLPPRMTTTQRDAISSPATGLQVYNTTTNQNNIYNGTSWIAVVTDADSYTHTFVSGDWGGVSGAYTLTITAATHGLGTGINNHNIYSDDGTSYISEVSTSVSINKTTGDVTLTSSSPTAFDGKITFKK